MSLAIKKKRISKKNKSAWRKTDIKDVEEFLEEQRQEERIGSFAEKKDEELFTVDVEPQAQERPKRIVLNVKQQRRLNAQRPFRSLEALVNTSKVTDPIAKRNHVKPKKNGRIIEDEVRNPTKPRHFQANKDRQRYYEQLEKKLQKSDKALKTAKDIWVEEDFRDKIPGLKDEKGWISRDLAYYNARNMGKALVEVHDSLRHRTTKAKNFEPPHPGMSYNPSLKDHQALIEKVVEREVKIIKTEKHLKRVTTQMFNKVTPEERDELRLKEMRVGLEDDDDDEEEEKADGDKNKAMDTNADPVDTEAPYTANTPVENKKKSKRARRIELQQKQLKQKHDEKKALKKQIADLNRIKSIKNEVISEAEQLKALKTHRKAVAEKKKSEPKRLGQHKYADPDVDVNMAEDIAGNLRNVKPESSLLVDRFKSFQKRNMLATSVATGKQPKKKIKRFVRSSHKEPGVSFDMLRQQRKAQQQLAKGSATS